MKSRLSGQSLKLSAYAITSALAVATLAGCGASNNFTSSGLGPDTAVEGIGGTVHGGPNPVIGATVTLYATATVASPSSSNAYGYGQPGTVLGSTTTDGSGNFTLTGAAASCTAGQQAYIVAAGGHTGQTIRPIPRRCLMAALGPCAGISNSTQVFINEATTIASAYALSGFMTVNGTTVDISAPANNNAATAACTVVANATTSCAASGLAHAFLNAATLVNSSTGAVNSTVTTGSTRQLWELCRRCSSIRWPTLLRSCVNSSGSNSTPCTTLMTNTTPNALVSSPTAPINTLQALLDLALYPSDPANAATAGTGTPPTGGPGPSARHDGPF